MKNNERCHKNEDYSIHDCLLNNDINPMLMTIYENIKNDIKLIKMKICKLDCKELEHGR